MKNTQQKKLAFYGGTFGRLIPLLTALLFILLAAISESDVSGYSVAFFAAVAAGCLFAKDRSAYGEAAIAGLARPMFGTVAVAILFAAVDGKLVAASGLIDSLAFLLVKARVSGAAFCAVSFLLCCLLSMSTGTSVGTYVVSMPLLFPLGILVGADRSAESEIPMSGSSFGASFPCCTSTALFRTSKISPPSIPFSTGRQRLLSVRTFRVEARLPMIFPESSCAVQRGPATFSPPARSIDQPKAIRPAGRKDF